MSPNADAMLVPGRYLGKANWPTTGRKSRHGTSYWSVGQSKKNLPRAAAGYAGQLLRPIRASILGCLLLAGWHSTALTQVTLADFDTVLDSYVALGLQANLALQSESLEVEKALQSLAETRECSRPPGRTGVRHRGRRSPTGSGDLSMRTTDRQPRSLGARVLLVLIAGCAVAGCDSTASDVPPTLTPVRIATAVAGPAAPTIRTNGLLVNKDEIRLSFKVGGVLKFIAVEAGQPVHKGQKLAQIEQVEIDAQVEQARQAHAKALRDVQRGERLYEDKVVSLEHLQDLRTQAAVTRAALKSAEFNRNYAAIVAPGDGTVLRRLAEERELVAAGAPVIVLGARDRGYVVRAGLADREVVQVELGDAAEIRLDALPEASLTGKVIEIASAADSASGMFNVEVLLEHGGLPLKSGLIAKLSIVPASARASERIYIPISAIVEGNSRTASVFVLEGQHVRRREVRIAFIDDESVALTSGIADGEHVVTDGALYVEDGEQVAVQEAG